MSVEVQVNLYTEAGQFIDVVDGWDKLDATIKINDVGDFTIDVPYKFWKYLGRDSRFEILRSVDGGPLVNFGKTHWFARKFVRTSVGNPITVSGPNAMILIKRLIVAYPANSTQALVSATPTDDAIKGLFDNNLVYNGVPTPPRGYKLVARQPLYGQGPNIDKGFSWREVLATAQDMAQDAQGAGFYVTFDVLFINGVFELRTYVGCRGVDRREGFNLNPLILSEEAETLTNVQVTDDYTDEATVIYAGGPGEEALRQIGFAYDQERINASSFNYIEKFIEATNLTTLAALNAEAARELVNSRPKHLLNADMVDGPGNRLDVNYGLGDFATARYDTDSFSVEVNAVNLTLDQEKGEQITTRLEGTLWTSN
ncbi:MAG: hypothetical protein BGO39_05075 [Chloroflexi bacterium 54-19]|nr:MAG: hypothetical protein BGO39_05075 [Chloroflexi bacterium 54-19]